MSIAAMRPTLLACALLTLAVPAAPAAATPGYGAGCGYAFLADPGDPTGRRQVGEIDGGPVLLDDGAAARTGRLVCSIQFDLGWHDAPDVVRAESPTTAGVAVLPATPFTVELDPRAYPSIYVCEEVRVDGVGTFYRDADMGGWATDPDVSCQGQAVAPPQWDPLGWIPWEVIDPPPGGVDPIVCPALAQAFPPEGDVPGVWDCPPYA